MLISPEYAALNARMHEDKPSYGTSSAQWAPLVTDLAQQIDATSVLDYGAGKGHLRKALPATFEERGWLLMEYDPGIPELSAPPSAADLVVCTDVLEHVEPACLVAVLDHIRELALKVVLIEAATKPAMKTLADGRNAHILVEPASWWLPLLMARWKLSGFNATPQGFLFVGTAK